MAVTGAPSTTALQAARTAGAAAAGVGYQVPSGLVGTGRSRRGALARPDQDADDGAGRVEEGRAGDGQALHVDIEHPQQGGAVASVRVDLPLHGRDGGAQVRTVRREHHAEVLPGRVGVARAEALGPLERRRDEQRQVRPAIAPPDLGVNQRSVCIANVGSVGARQAGEGGQHPAVARENGPDGHRHSVSLERDDPAEHVLVELLWGERGVGRLRRGSGRGAGRSGGPRCVRRFFVRTARFPGVAAAVDALGGGDAGRGLGRRRGSQGLATGRPRGHGDRSGGTGPRAGGQRRQPR